MKRKGQLEREVVPLSSCHLRWHPWERARERRGREMGICAVFKKESHCREERKVRRETHVRLQGIGFWFLGAIFTNLPVKIIVLKYGIVLNFLTSLYKYVI